VQSSVQRPQERSRFEVPIIIPAFQPGVRLAALVGALSGAGASSIIVVNDGSGPDSDRYFEELKHWPGTIVLRHAINLGKGAALKTGINHALCAYPHAVGVVTADADGQHHAEDILKVGRRLLTERGALVLGTRRFGDGVPVRSRLGNHITATVMRFLVGTRLSDTQTGLRGIPRDLLPHLLVIPSPGYEFELDMLIACKHHSVRIVEERIRTIYLEGNRSSHFNPLLDSLRIYFTLLRYSMVSILTTVIDNLVFYLLFQSSGIILSSQIGGRLVALVFNYTAARKAVFLSNQPHRTVLTRYLLLVVASGLLSYMLINFLSTSIHLPVISAKVIAETALFFANFAIQRDFVFTRAPRGETVAD